MSDVNNVLLFEVARIISDKCKYDYQCRKDIVIFDYQDNDYVAYKMSTFGDYVTIWGDSSFAKSKLVDFNDPDIMQIIADWAIEIFIGVQ